jgi:hypothetical protein
MRALARFVAVVLTRPVLAEVALEYNNYDFPFNPTRGSSQPVTFQKDVVQKHGSRRASSAVSAGCRGRNPLPDRYGHAPADTNPETCFHGRKDATGAMRREG